MLIERLKLRSIFTRILNTPNSITEIGIVCYMLDFLRYISLFGQFQSQEEFFSPSLNSLVLRKISVFR